MELKKNASDGLKVSRRKQASGAGKKYRKSQSAVADLMFGPSIDRCGFTPAGISGFSDLRPAAVVRELIQNAMDAALIEAEETCAHVRFVLSQCSLKDIPGIQSFRDAFDLAVKQGQPSGSAKSDVERIRRALNETNHQVLTVIDNGVGLDGKRMSALLSDGISAKGGKSAGTFGNGHSAVIPASNLRYVLYGGVTADGDSYGSGQAVLASHWVQGEDVGRSGRGMYLESIEQSALDQPLKLARGEAIPPMVQSALEHVRHAHGHGSAVIIPAFNNFVDHDQSLQETVFRAASCNFFQAIHEGILVVEVESSGEHGVLNDRSLPDVLAKYRNQTRTDRRGSFLSGRKANEAHMTLKEGNPYEVDTGFGFVQVRVALRDSGRQSVGLCRNGMWITDEIPTFQNAFSDRQPFQALILLRSLDDTEFFNMVKDAETPLHDKLAIKRMEPDSRRRDLRRALKAIQSRIAEIVPESTRETYIPDDIFAFQFEDVEAGGRGGSRQPSFGGRMASSRRQETKSQEGSGGEKGGVNQGGEKEERKGKKRRAVVVEPSFRIASVPSGERERKVHLECTKDTEDAEFRVFIDENVDATCDPQTRTQAQAVLLSNIRVAGHQLEDSKLVHNDEGVVGVKLGSLLAGSSLLIETNYAISSGALDVVRGCEPALRIEVTGSREVLSLGGSSSNG